VKQLLKPLGRALKYGYMKHRAERRVAAQSDGELDVQRPRAAFLIGCGRSGTTVLGMVLNQHPQVYYFFEPYHLWATIDPSIDVLNLYSRDAARFLLDQQDCADELRRRFDRLMLAPARRLGKPLVIEKTPFNACRIGYLDALKPGSKFIHLIRSGLDVVYSIRRLSSDRSYRIAGTAALNRWWGRGASKWTALAVEGMAAGYFANEVPLLQSYESKGAYEWIVSLAEVDRWRSRLGDRLLEMTYDQLTVEPTGSIQRICDFLSLEVPAKWLGWSVRQIDTTRRNTGPPLVLPPRLCQEFNRLQERFGFDGRAVAGRPPDAMVRTAAN
jgi:hypothetical protein